MTNKLTDLELCKRIAEIAFPKECCSIQVRGGSVWVCHQQAMTPFKYNPLTNKALLFDLMVKHRISLVMNGNGDNHAFEMSADNDIYQPDPSLIPRAILECIVQAQSNPSK